jgi:hypothetical protein
MAAPEGPQHPILLFLGAGASAAAKVPMTVAMLQAFREDTSQETAHGRDLLGELERFLDSHRVPPLKVDEPERDIERTFETVAVLQDISGTASPLLSPDMPPRLRMPEALQLLKDELQTYVRKRCLVRPVDLAPLLSFRKFFERFDRLDIVTVNYDIVVELLCEINQVQYSDGFQLFWDDRQFERTPVRIYKLHGSAIWFQSPREGYLKVPLRFESNRVERLRGETATPLMMYPAEKWDDSEVFLALHSRFHRLLRDNDWMVVVGYSFRDEHLNHAILEEARANPNLKILLISPNAEEVYASHLRTHAAFAVEPLLFSERPLLENRVVRLPFRWENILEDFVDAWYDELVQGFSQYYIARQQIANRIFARLPELTLRLLEAGALDQALEIRKYVDLENQPEDWRLRYACSMAAVLYSIGRAEDAEKSWETARAILENRYVTQLAVQMSGSETYFVGFNSGTSDRPQFSQSNNAHTPLSDALRVLNSYTKYTTGDTRVDWIGARQRAVFSLLNYFEGFRSGPRPLASLLDERRRKFKSGVEDIEAFIKPFSSADRIARKAEIEELIRKLESRYLSEIVFGPLGPQVPS